MTGPAAIGLRAVLAACILAGPGAAQSADSARSTRAGVYTADQAARGSEVYALSCASCHTAATHTGPAFTAKWNGRPLAELFDFIRESMPKNDPGSLSPREYFLAMIYVLQMNGVPAGPDPLPADPAALQRIRIDFAAADTSHQR